MNSQIIEAKQNLINSLCNYAQELIESTPHVVYCKCGWVDFVSDDLVQYEIVGVYIGYSSTGKPNILLVHKTGSEGSVKGNIFKLKDITSVDAIESIIKGLIKVADESKL